MNAAWKTTDRAPRQQTWHTGFLVLFGLLGCALILLSTSRHGAGLSPDSVTYIGAARSLEAGEGLVSHTGDPISQWPPLYPVVLSMVGWVFGADPLAIAGVVNAGLFGLILVVSGQLTFWCFPDHPALGVIAPIVYVTSVPLLETSVMAWSEPLFIVLAQVSLISAFRYLRKEDWETLLRFSAAVALAALTKYMGVVLIGWGAIILVAIHRNQLEILAKRLFSFLAISSLPIGLWLVGNITFSGTLAGPRHASAFSLLQVLLAGRQTIAHWYLPEAVTGRPLLSMLVTGAVIAITVIGVVNGKWWQLRSQLRSLGPIVLFVVMYSAALFTTSAITAVDRVNDRLLSPVFLPLTLILLAFGKNLAELLQARPSLKFANAVFVIGVTIGLVHPGHSALRLIRHQIDRGLGYSNTRWQNNETIKYLLHAGDFVSECPLYSNDPYAIYMLTGINARTSPAKTFYNSNEVAMSGEEVARSWPKEGQACLVWFNGTERSDLYTLRELTSLLNLRAITELNDGAIYLVLRR